MAQDIVPIELGLPKGDLVTLWAPRWREDGEEWEAFLGDEEHLFAFADAARLAAFVRTAADHDLTDHPAWAVVPGLPVAELIPDEDHHYDLVGVPELVAEEPDTWTIGELADVIAMIRSVADVCELEKVHEILDSVDGFAVLDQGTFPFTGRDGQRRWDEMSKAIVERWDDVLDAIDSMVTDPEVDPAALAVAETELAEATAAAEQLVHTDEDDEDEQEPLSPAATFWAEVGIDPIKIVVTEDELYTLRCYLGDKPLFLGSNGKIDVFTSPRALARHVLDSDGEHDLMTVSTWPDVITKATGGELEIDVDPDNIYVLTGLADDLGDGPEAVDPNQLDLAVELLTDAAEWGEDNSVTEALEPAESLGWLVNFVINPDPTRLAPSPPFDKEVTTWRELVEHFEERLTKR
jgi:hypothetical protein